MMPFPTSPVLSSIFLVSRLPVNISWFYQSYILRNVLHSSLQKKQASGMQGKMRPSNSRPPTTCGNRQLQVCMCCNKLAANGRPTYVHLYSKYRMSFQLVKCSIYCQSQNAISLIFRAKLSTVHPNFTLPGRNLMRQERKWGHRRLFFVCVPSVYLLQCSVGD